MPLSTNLDKGCDVHDYIACNDFTTHNHNHIVVTSAAMMTSSERERGGAEKSDWSVTGDGIEGCRKG